MGFPHVFKYACRRLQRLNHVGDQWDFSVWKILGASNNGEKNIKNPVNQLSKDSLAQIVFFLQMEVYEPNHPIV